MLRPPAENTHEEHGPCDREVTRRVLSVLPEDATTPDEQRYTTSTPTFREGMVVMDGVYVCGAGAGRLNRVTIEYVPLHAIALAADFALLPGCRSAFPFTSYALLPAAEVLGDLEDYSFH